MAGLHAASVPEASPAQEQKVGGEDGLRAGVDQIARDFEASLREDASLTEAKRTEISQGFAEALEQQLASGGGTPSLPDRQEWTDAIAALRRDGALDESDAAEIIRQLDAAFSQFERHETKLAIEFSRRMQADGEDSAMAWLREQQSAANTDGETAAPAPGGPVSRPLAGDVVNSRSRRLRGPPKS